MNGHTRPVTRAAASLLLLAAGGPAVAESGLGQMSCERIEGTTYNFIITSKADVRCIFKGQGDAEQWYRGETGIAIGLDLKWTSSEKIEFAVLSTTTEYTPEGDFLSGDYSGAKVDAAVGVGVGGAVLIGGSDDTTALQPAVSTSEGVGVSAGVGYLTIGPDPLNIARIATPTGDFFTQALYSAYFSVALEEYRAGRYEASDFFAGKALAAARGERVAPDRVQGRDLDADALTTLEAARERVVAAQGNEFASSAIGEEASVQAYFDCWLRATTPPAAPARVEDCRQYYETRMTALEAHLKEQLLAADTVDKLMQPRWYIVYFDTDVSAIGGGGQAVVDDIVNAFKSFKAARVYVWGHTDRAGPAEYNMKLSDARANNVREALVLGGVPVEWIRTVGYGATKPVVVSTNPHDATNRRVNVVVEPLDVKLN